MDDNGGEVHLRVSQVNISRLPDEVMFVIFKWFDTFQLMPFSRVCKRWMWLIDDSRLRKVLDFRSPYSLQIDSVTTILYRAPLLHTFSIAYLEDSVNRVIQILAENSLHLSVLKLAGCSSISEESWQLIGAAPWPRLTHISLSDCGVDNHALATILPTVSMATVLDITYNRGVTNDGIVCITGHTPNLRCLLLHMTISTSASTVPLLEAVGSHLTQLSFTRPDHAMLEALPTLCVCLRVLALFLMGSPMDAVAGCLQRLPHLTHLRLSSSNFLGRPQTIRGLFNVTHEGLSRLEHLALDGVPVDDHVLGEIAQTCGSHLRYLSIIDCSCPIRAVGWTEVASRCTVIEQLEWYSHRILLSYSALEEVVSNMPQLRILVANADYEGMTALENQLAASLPEALISSMTEFYKQTRYKRYRLPNILCDAALTQI